ncbi:MAG: hypothetical protein Q8N05_19060 [Bacteroidota bacterium]|nr:hypothetical protein [Bacteroidota bacterium]
MKKLILFIYVGFVAQLAFSQTNVVEFLKGGKADAKKLTEAYLNPYAMALGDGLNNGWYNSAETHMLFGFDLTVSVSAIQIPEEAKTFDVSLLHLDNMVVVSGGNFAPTIAGKDISGPKLQVNDSQGNPMVSFNTPNGVGLDVVPVPMAQIGFGLLPHTDLIGRYVPEMTYDNNGDEMKLGFWGAGAKHNFMEWIPVLKELPFDASVFGSYSEVNAQSALSFSPLDYTEPNVKVTFSSDKSQFLKVNTKTTKYGLIISKKLGILTFFGGIGQSSSVSTIDMIGKYPVVTKASGGGLEITDEDALIDPISLQFESKNICMDAGFRLKVAVLSLFGSINKAQYTSYNVGVSLGAR